ncbi:uncharacterized protein LOC62_06G008076 [Vanrija pseudolonga]|uniref:Uncharacterized protein n=1 Tax=Vanrija pseudolonga TaxID=143232 RepID=A0AAF0YD68_9TREE|nr:hypothetical protein LOC62_06G008076 [Vanrija pseudolonga]
MRAALLVLSLSLALRPVWAEDAAAAQQPVAVVEEKVEAPPGIFVEDDTPPPFEVTDVAKEHPDQRPPDASGTATAVPEEEEEDVEREDDIKEGQVHPKTPKKYTAPNIDGLNADLETIAELRELDRLTEVEEIEYDDGDDDIDDGPGGGQRKDGHRIPWVDKWRHDEGSFLDLAWYDPRVKNQWRKLDKLKPKDLQYKDIPGLVWQVNDEPSTLAKHHVRVLSPTRKQWWVAGTDNRLWIEPTEQSALPARFPATALLVDVGRREELTGPGVWGIRSMIPPLELGSPYGQPKVPGLWFGALVVTNYTVTLPDVPAGKAYVIKLVNIRNAKEVYWTSPRFEIRAPGSKLSEVSARTLQGGHWKRSAAERSTTAAAVVVVLAGTFVGILTAL